MTTIYVLTEGYYSDYHIVALFSTRETAEEAHSLCPDSKVEEYELDALVIPQHPLGFVGWTVNINVRTCEITRSEQFDTIQGKFEPQAIHLEFDGRWTPIFRVKTWARDKEHAEKIALDEFYQWKWEKELNNSDGT